MPKNDPNRDTVTPVSGRRDLPSRTKLFYGLGDLSLNIAYTAIGFYFIFFLVNVAGLPPAWAGVIFLVARLWDAVTDYAMGLISDGTHSAMGRRRPYIIAGALPLAVTFALLWLVPFQGRSTLFVYYLVAIMLFNTAFTVVAVPYGALMPELTDDYNERTSLSAYRMGSSFVGNLVAAAGVALIVDVVYPGAPFYRTSYPVMGILLGALAFVFLLFPFFGTREKRRTARQETPPFFASLRSMFKLREFRYVLGLFLLNMTGLDIFMAMVMFFLKDALAIPDNFVFVIMGLPLVSAVLAAPLWSWLARRFGKKRTYVSAAIFFCAIMLAFNLIPVGAVGLTIAMAAAAGLGISAMQIIPWSILPDVVEFDELENGARREGAFYGISTFLYKLASALAIALTSALLGAFGYIEGSAVAQSSGAVGAVRLIFTVGPVAFLIASAIVAAIMPIDKKRFDIVLEKLRARKAVSESQPRL